MAQHIEDYMARCSDDQLRREIELSREGEQEALREASRDMAAYFSWTRFYAERELRLRATG